MPLSGQMTSRIELGPANVHLYRQLIPVLARTNPDAIMLIITVDIMTYLATRLSGFPASRILGIGTLVDSVRFRSRPKIYTRISSATMARIRFRCSAPHRPTVSISTIIPRIALFSTKCTMSVSRSTMPKVTPTSQSPRPPARGFAPLCTSHAEPFRSALILIIGSAFSTIVSVFRWWLTGAAAFTIFIPT